MDKCNDTMWRVPSWNGFEIEREQMLNRLNVFKTIAIDNNIIPEVPETGRFRPVSFSGRFVNDEWMIRFSIDPSSENENLRDLSMGARVTNSDLLVSNYVLFNVTKAQIIQWFEEEFVSNATLDEWSQLLETLHNKLSE